MLATTNTAHRWLLAMLVAVALVTSAAPRSIATVFAIVAIAATVLLYRARPFEVTGRPLPAPVLWILAFSLWALLSALWSPVPGASAGKALGLAGFAAGAVMTARAIQLAGPLPATPLARALFWALLAGVAFAAFEVLTDQLGTRTAMTWFPGYFTNLKPHMDVVDRVVLHVDETNINRRVGLATLFLTPLALALAATLFEGQLRTWLQAGLAVTAAAMIGSSGHQSSQVAAVAGVLIFLVAKVSLRGARRLAAIGFTVASLLVVPIVLVAHNSAHLNEAPWLFASARDRVVIWGYTANEVLKHPFFGVGADATPAITNAKRALGELANEGQFEASPSRHAHNDYLQIWFELGIVGAGLTFAAGLGFLGAIGRLPTRIQPYALAQFIVTTAMAAFSYSIWQMWFEAAIAAGAVALLAAAGLMQPRPDVTSAAAPATAQR